MSAIVEDEKWRKFFETYRSLSEIWQVKSDAYKNRDRRNRAWRTLLEVYRNIDKNASMEKLRHRINNIRACHRRELRKIHESERYRPDAVHVPTLWYFNLLDFLKDQETINRGRWARRAQEIEELELDDDDIILSEAEIDIPSPPRYKFKKHVERVEASDKLQTLEPSKDEANIYSEGWACSYRKLSSEQQLYAKKAIEEILIMGQLNALTLDVVDSNSKLTTKPDIDESNSADQVIFNTEDEMQFCMEDNK